MSSYSPGIIISEVIISEVRNLLTIDSLSNYSAEICVSYFVILEIGPGDLYMLGKCSICNCTTSSCVNALEDKQLLRKILQ